ncbi:hypothetical protein EPUS_00471 [Endocarpon pusillum Z07020]|uniref:Uncharacterized protein n=1 Tax=Endocarpon pusillum (strain Z07020 / HMAS-L-300199) TaxID=1263415 RepID=U1G2H1_ENDPU|nr:uncharacterized protein EPUS_00471 [Endocarpon pusillum Z07020]ERF71482.1 hypothetical protein EPUS_00471 [Endocarpon pusillum Z07020]
MDAKPQRPVRILRVRPDENALPTLPGGKTIHQRNKSSPALSSALGAAGLKAPAKRTAFGDVSNTNNGVRPTKDDGAIQLKQAVQVNEKPVSLVADKKTTTFLKQASRPYSVANLRGLLAGGSGNTSTEVVTKPTPTETDTSANYRKQPTKRSTTTIFKDVTLSAVEEPASKSRTEIESAATSISLTKPSLPLDVSFITNGTDVQQPEAILASDASLDRAEKSWTEPNTESNEVEDLAALRSDGIYIDDNGNVQIYQEVQLEADDRNQPTYPLSKPASTGQTKLEVYPASTTEVHASSVPVADSVQSQLAQRAEPEEYWEEDDENYDEEGYVTARSFRSRGENTTGGATTVLFPLVNQKIKKEIEAAKQLVEAERTPEEIEDECFDTSMVAEYGDEIFEYMKDLEVKMLPNPHYMDNQAEIKWSMRTVLMDWVIQVHHRFNLLPETLFLTVNYIDRFLSCKIVSLGKLQLVGATAIFIAAKYEEINCPSVQEIVYMVDGGYTIDEILKAERFMLTMLQFELGWPGPMSFLRRISKADDYDLETRTLAKYFLEVTVMDEQFLGSPPSFTAAAAHCLARLMLRKGRWTPQHVCYSDYTYTQLLRLLPRIVECCEQPRKHHAQVFQKYSDKRYKRASIFVEGEMARGFMLPASTKDSGLPYTPQFFDPSAWRHL